MSRVSNSRNGQDPPRKSDPRFWYGGRKPIEPEVLLAAEVDEEKAQVLYTLADGRQEGEYLDMVKALQKKMADPSKAQAWAPSQGMQTFLKALLNFTSSTLEQVQILERVGTFEFPAEDTANKKKTRIEAALAEFKGYSPAEGQDFTFQLAEIWAPQPESLLDSIIHHPGEIGRMLAERLDPALAPPLKVIGHSFAGVHESIVRYLAETHTVAYERNAQIHLIAEVREVLEEWDKDSFIQTGLEQFNLFEVLLMHELAEVVLTETTRLEALPAHIVASTLEYCLKGPILPIAVEAFFIDWSPPTADPKASGKVSLDQVLKKTEPPPVEKKPRVGVAPPGHIEEGHGVEEEEVDGKDTNVAVEDEEEGAIFSPKPERTRTYRFESRGSQSGKCVLVVDDSAMMRLMVCEAARQLGHQAVEAVDGVEGITLAKHYLPDLIILDVHMAEKGGIQTLQELRGDSRLSITPVIMLTVDASQTVVREAMEEKADEYLLKPVNTKALKERIQRYLDK